MIAELNVGHAYVGEKPSDETLCASGIRRGAYAARNVQGGARAVRRWRGP